MAQSAKEGSTSSSRHPRVAARKTKSAADEKTRAAVTIQCAWRVRCAHRKADALRERRALRLIQMLKKPEAQQLGGKFGVCTTFSAPNAKYRVSLGLTGKEPPPPHVRARDRANTSAPQLNTHDFHVAYLVSGLARFYTKHNPEAVPRVEEIARRAAGHEEELRDKLMKKYPSVPSEEFDWLLPKGLSSTSPSPHTPSDTMSPSRSSPRTRSNTLSAPRFGTTLRPPSTGGHSNCSSPLRKGNSSFGDASAISSSPKSPAVKSISDWWKQITSKDEGEDEAELSTSLMEATQPLLDLMEA